MTVSGMKPVEIDIALPMGMRAHVDQHIIDIDGHVSAVVEIVAAQNVLVGFALAAVLRNNETRRGFKNFAPPYHGPCIDLASRNMIALARLGAIGGPPPTLVTPDDPSCASALEFGVGVAAFLVGAVLAGSCGVTTTGGSCCWLSAKLGRRGLRPNLQPRSPDA